MSIRFTCPECGHKLSADESTAGRRAQCSRCRAIVVIPPARASIGADGRDGEPILRRRPVAESSDDEIDMTPMIDVVFQLLIFFMVTAAFGLQKSLPVPPPTPIDDASQAAAAEGDDDLVTVRIDADDSLWVDGAAAVSRQDLIAKLRKARGATSAAAGDASPRRRLLVSADPDCRHESVVLALDAGSAAGMEEVELATAEQDSFY